MKKNLEEITDLTIDELDLLKSDNYLMLNIFIMGTSQTGKNTLLNTVFGKNFIPVSKEFDSYTNKDKKLAIWNATNIQDLSQILENNTFEDFSYVAWLCIEENDLQTNEWGFDLLALTQKYNIPAVAIFNFPQNEKNDILVKKIQKQIKEKELNIKSFGINLIRENIDFLSYYLKTSDYFELPEKSQKCIEKYQNIFSRTQILDYQLQIETMVLCIRDILFQSFKETEAIDDTFTQAQIIAQINDLLEIKFKNREIFFILEHLLDIENYKSPNPFNNFFNFISFTKKTEKQKTTQITQRHVISYAGACLDYFCKNKTINFKNINKILLKTKKKFLTYSPYLIFR